MQYNVTPFVCGDTLTFYAQTSDPSSDGDAADAASPPAYRIYRGENGTPVATGTMSLLDDANTIGFYSEAIPITGYAPGTYCIRLTASVGTSDGAGLAGFIVGGAGPLVVRTTIATLASQTSFTLTAGPAEDIALLHHMVIIRDAASVDQFAIGYISAYTGSTKTVTLDADPGIFTMAVGDFVEVWGPVSSNMTKHGGTAYTAGAIPAAVAGANGGLPTVDGNNRVAGIVGTITTLDALDTAQDTQHSTTQTAIADLPTNAELATALGTADDAVLAAIAALNNLSQANIRTAIGLGSANLDTQLAAIAADLPTKPERGAQFGPLPFLMVDETDGMTPEPGVTVTATISKDGGAFAACSNSASEISGGFYKLTLTASEMTADVVALKLTATGCAQRSIIITTQPT